MSGEGRESMCVSALLLRHIVSHSLIRHEQVLFLQDPVYDDACLLQSIFLNLDSLIMTHLDSPLHCVLQVPSLNTYTLHLFTLMVEKFL